MPDGSDEKISVAPIIAAIEAPCLSDLSERDKPWDKHRSNTDRYLPITDEASSAT